MKKWICTVCGYVWEGENPPEKCPQCGVPASKFTEQKGERAWAAEHVVGVAKGCPQEIIDGLRANFAGECSEVGMYPTSLHSPLKFSRRPCLISSGTSLAMPTTCSVT